MDIERTKLSRLAASLTARGITFCRSKERPGYFELRVLTQHSEERVICTIGDDALFDQHGNYFEDDLP